MIIKFVKYLHSKSFSNATVKNYKSDISHFTLWLKGYLKKFGTVIDDLSEAVPFLGEDVSQNYKSAMVTEGSAIKTINRRLSSLRALGRFLSDCEYLPSDFTSGLSNVSLVEKKKNSFDSVVSQYREHLTSQKMTKNTIKNNLSDIKHFLNWLEQQEHAQLN